MQTSLRVLLLSLLGSYALAGPTATTSAGTLTGGTCAGGLSAVYYKSIPFAQPPVGNLRFAAPQAYKGPYEGGKLDATQAAPACIQFGSVFEEKGPQSEDCLYIDVWTPNNASSTSALPVRVWLYGGSNSDGGISDPMYDGCNVAAAGTLQVNINYRLGPLGFMALSEAGIGGNQGIQDILLGLQWVQDNIAAFGGDPKKVLLHGQSAGALDSFLVSSLPQAPKLISVVACESGAGRRTPSCSVVETISQSYAHNLNCSVSDTACFQKASISALNTTYLNLPLENNYKFEFLSVSNSTSPNFAPCVDGQVVPSEPAMQGTRVPAIFGSSADEGNLFALGQFSQGTSGNPFAVPTAADYSAYLAENFGPAASLIEEHYPLSAFNSTPYPPFAAIETVFTDSSYRCPTFLALQKAFADNVPAYAYVFSHAPKCNWIAGLPQEAAQLLGPTHTVEIPFVFGHTENEPLPGGNCSFTDVEIDISRFMVDAWSSMASVQKPADSSVWPLWGGPQVSKGINITNSTGPPSFIDYSVCELWSQVFAMAGAGGNGTMSSNGTTGGSNGGGYNSTGGSSSSGGSAGPTSPVSKPGTSGASGLVGASSATTALLGAAAVLIAGLF